MSLIGPRPTLPAQVAQYTARQRGRLAIKPGITGWAQVNGRASLPWAERIELDLYYIEHRSLALDLRILWRTLAMVLGGSGLYKGETRRLGGRAVSPPAILLTGRRQALRHRLLLRRADEDGRGRSHPLAPAQYAAHVRAAVPLIDDPGYVPALAELCEQHGVGAVMPLTDLDIEVLARAREDGPPARARALPGGRARDLRQVRGPPAAPAPRPALAADGAARARTRRARYPVMVKPRAARARARSTSRATPRRRVLRRYVAEGGVAGPSAGEPVMVQRAMGGPELSIDCLGDLRRALPERDPAHDARVARRRVDQGRGRSATTS